MYETPKVKKIGSLLVCSYVCTYRTNC